MFIKNIYYNLKKYSFLLQQLVLRDFKVKYKRSILGIVWSLLYPLLMMVVMAIVFSNIFKMNMPGINYFVYLQIGLTFFNYFSEASNLAMSSVVANFSLINKIYIPKYIFPLSKVLFVAINFLITLIPLYGVILLTGEPITAAHLALPFVFLCLIIFTLGIGFILSTIAVFFRDMFYIYSIIITLWTYLTPIMYDISMIDSKYQMFLKFNPLYQFINFARTIILGHRVPELIYFVYCLLAAFVPLIIGITVFKRNQDKFIYYI